MFLLVVFFQRGASVGYVNAGTIYLSKSQMGLAGDLRSAEQLLQQALRWNPENAETCRHLGTLYFLKPKLPQAASQFETGLVIDPGDVLLHYYLAKVYREEGRDDEARGELRLAGAWRLLRTDYAEKGLVLFDEGKYAEAEGEFWNLAGAAVRLKDSYWITQGYQWLSWRVERHGRQADAWPHTTYRRATIFGAESGPGQGAMIGLERLQAHGFTGGDYPSDR